MSHADELTECLDEVEEDCEDGDPTIGELVDDLAANGYGPILMLISVLVILPTGMIPGVPGVAGALLVLLGGQMVAGRARPWIPRRLREFKIDHDRLHAAVDRCRPAARWISRFLEERLEVLAGSGPARRLIGVCLIVVGIAMLAIGFVPGVPFVVGLPVLLFGLGMTSRDGAVVLVGFALFLLAAGAVYWLAA